MLPPIAKDTETGTAHLIRMKLSPILALTLTCSSLPAIGQTIISYSDADRMDSSNDGVTWSFPNSNDSALLAGDSSNGDTIFESAILIDISAFDSEIAAASEIILNIAYSSILGTGQDVTAILFGTNDGTTSAIGATTFHDSAIANNATGNAGTILSTEFSAPGVASYDVSSILPSLTTFDYVGVLLTSGITTNTGSEADALTFYRTTSLDNQANGGAYFEVIPEPNSSATLAGVIAIGVKLIRRRRAS